MTASSSHALSELATFHSGGTPNKRNREFWNGNIPWVSPKDMKSRLLMNTLDHITDTAVEMSATRIAPKGSILVVARSGVLAHSLPVAQIGRPMAFNQDIKAILPNRDLIDSEYLFYFLRSKEREVISNGVKKGATVHSLRSGFIESLHIPIPSIEEQRRIVDILSRAEGIVRLQQQAGSTAQEIIPALFFQMFGDPLKNSMRWHQSKLGHATTMAGGATPSKQNLRFWGGAIPWVSPKDMKVARIVDSQDHVSELALEKTNLRAIPTDSILVVVRGMILAHTVPIARTAAEVTINQDMKALIPNDSLNTNYLLWLLKAMHRHLLGKVSVSAHGTRKLDTPHLTDLVVPIPPLHLQQEFSDHAQRIEAIQNSRDAGSKAAVEFLDSLINRAFSDQR